MMASATELPADLCCDPMSFVVLTGLDVTYNAVHKSIWDAFSNNRQVPLSSLFLRKGDYRYHTINSKRSIYPTMSEYLYLVQVNANTYALVRCGSFETRMLVKY